MNTLGTEFAAFNVDRTLIEDGFAGIVKAIGSLGLGPTAISAPFAESRDYFMNWIGGQTRAQFDLILNHVIDQGSETVAPWGLEAMSNLSRTGHALLLWSRVMPHEAVEACKQIIQTANPDIEIMLVNGSALERGCGGQFTGNSFPLLKAEVLEKLQNKGHRIKLVADSFASAYPAMAKASHIWAVNPDRALKNYREYPGMHTVEWWPNNPDITVVRSPGRQKVRYFHLGSGGQRRLFRKHVKTAMLK